MIAPLADVLPRLDAPPVGRCPEKCRAADGLLSRVDCAPGGWMAAPLRAVPRERESSLVTRSSRMLAGRIDTRGALVDVLVRAGRVMRDCVALVARKIRGGGAAGRRRSGVAPASFRRCRDGWSDFF
ncbi:hypothetical protein F511_45983 [Dorcoceras hygrometricum]|uniref:Uncharacterized protein n=1 Tax=Dorcoceras hygrometricum TaxID=472368 RepID=A0A2Z6ZUQ8_9LAMI|nr:hypothetical protein F511_45983 [Dorcoceras hygrometricum]